MTKFTKKNYFLILMLIGVLVGSFLRLYRIGSQIIWDDEWHSIYIALYNPLQYIVTHFHWDYNSIPLTIYFRIMLSTIGLNEIVVRLPQLFSGILMLVIFPLLVRRLFNRRVALIFLFVLSISPLLIYFSRNALTFSTVILASFTGILSFYLWMIERKVIYVNVYLISAILTPYFHISSIAFVSAPILYVVVLSLLKMRDSIKNVSEYIPQVKHTIAAFGIIVLGISLWLLPLIKSLKPIMDHKGQGFIDFGTLGGAATLFCGSYSYIIFSVVLVLLGYGLIVLYRQDKLLLSYLSFICFLQLVFILVTKPFLVQNSIVFTRYFISSLPVCLLIISVGTNELHLKLRSFFNKNTKFGINFSNFALVGGLLIVFFKGPLTDAYSFANDFTNHKDFQYKYSDRALMRAHGREGLYPRFYSNLKNQYNGSKIIEFPAILSWTWNIFHVYQRWHQNRVVVGYDSEYFGPFFGYDAYIKDNFKFNNFVDISNPGLLSGTGANFIVLHKNIWKECVTVGLFPDEIKPKMESRVSNLPISLLEGLQNYVSKSNMKLERAFGKASYEDDWIVVYEIK